MEECRHAEWDQDPINLGEKAGGQLKSAGRADDAFSGKRTLLSKVAKKGI